MSKNKKNRSQAGALWAFLAAVGVLVALTLVISLTAGHNDPESTTPSNSTNPVKIEAQENVNINLGYGLYITNVAKYTGIFMEDGTDEIVSGVLMIVVENTDDTDVQLAEIEMSVGKQTASFKLTTLPAGESMVLLETSRMQYTDMDFTTAIAKNVVLFQEPLSCCEDKIKIQILGSALNITNISGSDITGDVVIYYKNASSDMLYGGITYRVTVTGGLKAGEIKQLTGSHFSASGSRIMFVTIG